MLKLVLSNTAMNDKFMKILNELSYIIVFIGILYSVYVPRLANNNSIYSHGLTSTLNIYSQHSKLLEFYEQISEEIENFNGTSVEFAADFFQENHIEYKIENFTLKKENSIQDLENIVGIYRTRRSQNQECNLIAFDLSSENISLQFALAFIKYYQLPEINYVSKDVLFVGYDSKAKKYGKSIEEFLKVHYSENNNLPHCGIIREAINLDLEKDFNTIYYKVLGFDGKVPIEDYFLNFNKILNQIFQEDFKYTEVSSELPVQFANFLERNFENLSSEIGLKVPPNFFYNLKGFLHSLSSGFYGEKHDAHSELFRYGIFSVTFKGKAKESNSKSKVKDLFYAVDEGTRCIYTLNHEIFASPTFYYPVRKESELGIGELPIPIILTSSPFVVQIAYLYSEYNKEGKLENTLLIWGPFIFEFLHSLLMLSLPRVAEIIQEKEFCIDWDDYNNKDFDSLFFTLIFLVLSTRVIMEILWKYVLVKLIFQEKNELNYEEKIIEAKLIAIEAYLLAVFYIFFNTGISYLIVILFTPLLTFLQPLLPRKKSDIFFTFTNILSILLILYTIKMSNLNLFEEIKEIVVLEECVPSHTLWFAVCAGFNLIFSLFLNLIS